MALATQCPHCQTTFRVVQDQLKLRSGLVRCGSCKEIFNGIENLLRPDGSTVASSAAASTIAKSAAASPAPVPQPPAAVRTAPPSVIASAPVSATPPISTPAPVATPVPVARPTPAVPQLVAPQAQTAPTPETSDGIADFFDLIKNPAPELQAAKPAQSDSPALQQRDPSEPARLEKRAETPALPVAEKPLVPTAASLAEKDEFATRLHSTENFATPDLKDEDLPRFLLKDQDQREDLEEQIETEVPSAESIVDSDEPSFVTYGRRRQRISRAVRLLTGFGSLILFIGLLVQSTFVFRNLIAANFPQLKPAMVQACAALGCSVGLPAQIDSIVIESDGPHPLASNKDIFELTSLLRNYSQTAEAWPHIELILKDANGQTIVRRVFTPREYLSSPDEVGKGMPAASEQAVKLYFELTKLKAARYEVNRFYP